MTLDAGSFTFTRDIACASDRLWHLLTDAGAREIWGTPSEDHVLIVDQADVREGGRDRHRCGPADAPEFIIDTCWLKLASPVASFTETLIIGGEILTTSLVSYHMAETGAATKLTVELTTHSFVGPDGPKEHQYGWNHSLNRLQALVAEGHPFTR